MVTSKLSKNKPICIVLVLLNVHLIKGAIVHSTYGDGYYGESFILTFNITPSFLSTAVISQGGTTRSTCSSSFCGPAQHNDVTFTPSATGITLEFNSVTSSHQGSWQCSSNGDVSTYSFTPQDPPISVAVKAGLVTGAIVGIAVACFVVAFILCPSGVAGAVHYSKYRTRGSRKVHVIKNQKDNEETETKTLVLNENETKDIVDVIPEQHDLASNEWTHNGETLFKTKIEKAATKHAGLYVCKIKDERPLNIQLMILGTKETVYVRKGQNTILCNETSVGNTTAKWTHDGKLLSSKDMTGTTINIHNAVPKDTGLYVCTLSENGKSFKHQLIVIDDALMRANPDLTSYLKKSSSDINADQL